MGAHRLEHGVGGDDAGGAEIGRAEDRDIGDDPGIVDQIADAHDAAGDQGFRFEHRARRLGGDGRGGEDGQQGCGDGERADHG
jgi:hypothetical protein